MVFGNSSGLAVVDYLQKTLLLNMGTLELYSPSDPYQRQPRSPRKARQPSGGELHPDICRSLLLRTRPELTDTINPDANRLCTSLCATYFFVC